MGKDFAKFMATTDKKIVFGDKDVELKLTIPHKVAQANLQFLTSSLNKEIHVILGDPQLAFDFDDEGEDMYKPYIGGRQVTADASGVVTSIQQPEESKDENQGELFSSEGQEDGDQSEQQAENDTTDPLTDEEDQLNDYEQEIMREGEVSQSGSDLPEWMQEGTEGDGPTDSAEMNFEGESSDNSNDLKEEGQAADQADSAEVPASEIDKDELEKFILSEQPVFDDIPFDFPTLLRQRKEEGKTWMDISKETGVPSSQISSKYTAYKKRVVKMMQDGGAA